MITFALFLLSPATTAGVFAWASATYATEDGAVLTVERRGRRELRMSIATGDPKEDIYCSGVLDGPTIMSAQLTQAAGKAGEGEYTISHLGGVTPRLVQLQTDTGMITRTCEYGLTTTPDGVTLNLTSMLRYDRTVELSVDTVNDMATFMKATP